MSNCYAFLAALAVLPLVVLCQYDVETTCPESLVQEHPDQLAVFDGVCLRFGPNNVMFHVAGYICRNHGGMRVMPKTKEMDQFIIDYMKRNDWGDAWMGLKIVKIDKRQKVTQWEDETYLDGNDYSNFQNEVRWKSDDPKQIEVAYPGTCAYFHRLSGTWKPEYCMVRGIRKHFICQYK